MRNIPLEEISKVTKIKEHHLKAIEEDRYELLPPALYVKGYLNVYARYLNLNPKDIILQYENYLKSLIPPEPVELQHQVPPPKRAYEGMVFFILYVRSYSLYDNLHLLSRAPIYRRET